LIPIRDDNPHFLTPYAVLLIIGLNLLAWLLVQGLGTEPALSRSACTLGLVPGELLGKLPAGAAVRMGPATLCIATGSPDWFTLLSHMFLHGGWLHLIGNMWFLWIFGKNVEDAMGHLRFAAFYLLCGAAAAGLQIAVNPASGVPMVGASGAIGGVMGAYVVLYPRVRVEMLLWLGFYVTSFTLPAFWMLAYWFLIQLLGGVGALGGTGGGVAFWAHVGGFAAGALLVPLFRDPVLLARHPHHGWRQRPGHDGERWRR
jgi:membrane associated rhomboid family serine protease